MLYHELSASTTPRKTKATYESYDWLQIRILSKHNKNSTNFLNIKFGTRFIMWFLVLLSFLVFLSQYCVPYLCQPKKSLTSKPRSPNPVGTLGGVPFQRTPRANACGFNMSTTWIHQSHQWCWVSLQRIGSTRATLTWENLIVLPPSQILRPFFGVCFPLLNHMVVILCPDLY